MRPVIPLALIAAAVGLSAHEAPAQTGPAAASQRSDMQPVFAPLTQWKFPDRDAINAGTVTIVTAPAGGAKSVFAADMARVLDETDKLRILPVLGKGPVQNVIDVLYLRTIDMGLVATDVPEFFKIQYGAANITDRLRYIMKLYNDEIHIIAPTEIKTVFDLEGKRIEAPKDVGLYSARAIFSRLNINVKFDSTYLNDDTGALQQVVDGKADAWIVGTAKVMPIARNLKNESRRLHLVSIPYDRRLQDLYLPTEFTSDDYPNLIPAGETVETLAAGILLVAFNWPEKTDRYQKVANFIDALFSRIDEFPKPPRHPKWKEASISAVVPGWQRFKAAQDWLDRAAEQQRVGMANPASLARFKDFMAQKGDANLSPEQLEKLYAQFLEWNSRARR